MGTLKGFPNPPAIGSVGRSPTSPAAPIPVVGTPAQEARFARFLEAGGVEAADERGRRLQETLFASGSLLPDLLIGDVSLWPALVADPWLERQKPAAVMFE